MTEDITSLQIQIIYDKVEQAEKKLNTLTATGKKAEKGMKDQKGAAASLMGTIGKLALAYLSVNRAIAGFQAVIQTTREFEILRAQVTTATGSVENMEKAWRALLKFAATTPFELDESVKGFTRMINYGLAPSERAMRSFGDTAAAMGYGLIDLTESVAKATAGEYEPLRKFAITAKRDGDEVTFAFRGVKTTVKNSIEEIQKYFVELGEKNFAGAMEERMKTLDGKLSMLSDSWNQFKYNLGTSTGIAQAFGDVLLDLAGNLDKLSQYVSGGQLEKEMEIAQNGWGELGQTIAENLAKAVRDMEYLAKEADPNGEIFAGSWKDAFDTLPIALKAALDMGVAYLDWFVETGIAKADKFAAGFAIKLKTALTAADLTGRKFLSMGGDDVVKARFLEREKAAKQELLDFAKAYTMEETTVNDRLTEQLDTITAQYDAQKAKTAELRAQQLLIRNYDLASSNFTPGAMVLPDKPGGMTIADALQTTAPINPNAAVAIGDPSGSKPKKPKGGGGGGDGIGGMSENEMEKILSTQEDLISNSYQNRIDLIRSKTQEGSEYQMNLELAVTQQFEEEQRQRIEALMQQPEMMREAFAMEEQLIKDSYERRKEIILSATETTEEQKQKLLDQAAARYRSEEATRLVEYWQLQEKTMGDAMGNLAEISQAFGKKGFAAYKAFAMAQAAIAAPQAILQAYLGGLQWGGGNPAVATVFASIAAAATGVQIAAIASQEYSGAYATGGLIPPGKVGLVGEAGPELVKGPAMVTSAQATWDRRGADQTPAASNIEIRIINNSGENLTGQGTRRMEGNKELLEFIIQKASDAVANNISKGGTGVSRAIESTYNLGRGRR